MTWDSNANHIHSNIIIANKFIHDVFYTFEKIIKLFKFIINESHEKKIGIISLNYIGFRLNIEFYWGSKPSQSRNSKIDWYILSYFQFIKMTKILYIFQSWHRQLTSAALELVNLKFCLELFLKIKLVLKKYKFFKNSK